MVNKRRAMEPGTSVPASSGHAPLPGRRARLLIAASAIALVLGGVTAGAYGCLNSELVRGRIRSKVETALQQRIAGAQIEGALRFDRLGRLSLGPLRIPASRPGLPPVVRVEMIRVRPSWLSLLRGHVVINDIELRDVRIEAGPKGEELNQLAEKLRRTPASAHAASPPATPEPSALPPLQVRGLTLGWGEVGSDDKLELGPFEGTISAQRKDDQLLLDGQATLPGGGRGRLHLAWQDGTSSLQVNLRELSARSLPRPLVARIPFHLEDGRVFIRVEAEGLRTPSAGTATIEVILRDLVLTGERLASEPVGPMRLALRGQLEWDWKTRRLAFEDAVLSIGDQGEVNAELSAYLSLRGEPRFGLTARCNRLAYGAALAALPTALAPPSDAPHLDGPVTVDFELGGPLHRPEVWELGASLDLADLKQAAREASPPLLSGPFRYRPETSKRQILIGPANPSFVRLSSLPSYVVRAVTISEDAGFFGHQGFDFAEIRNAFVEGTEAGRVVRGGSTISQQLAKNLFLSGERTIARKVREALLTVALEASLGKSRLLEIYLNIVEWGPGIYGIGEAARHYFGKSATALTPREAAFLATIIPNPVRYHIYYERGALTANWNARVNDLLNKMRAVGLLGEDQFSRAISEPLIFERG